MEGSQRTTPLLLAIAVGDAYGAGFEFEPADIVARENNGRRYRQNAGNGALPGRYTDDTQMSLAIAELLVAKVAWTPENIADAFVRTYRRDVRPGYARGFESVLKQCETGADLLRLIKPNSDRNGAAMRAVPLGVLPTIREVREKAKIQAKITHDTPGGIASAQAVALTAHYGLYQVGKLADLPRFLEKQLPGYHWQEPWQGSVPLHGIGTARAAVTALVTHSRLSDLLKACVAYTGDTDSAAAIAVGCAVCFPVYTQNIPSALLRDLENGSYGRNYLRKVSKKLEALKISRNESLLGQLGLHI
jgi:ADP-ribosyl-[dinitrogen reductase] hydrolase